VQKRRGPADTCESVGWHKSLAAATLSIRSPRLDLLLRFYGRFSGGGTSGRGISLGPSTFQILLMTMDMWARCSDFAYYLHAQPASCRSKSVSHAAERDWITRMLQWIIIDASRGMRGYVGKSQRPLTSQSHPPGASTGIQESRDVPSVRSSSLHGATRRALATTVLSESCFNLRPTHCESKPPKGAGLARFEMVVGLDEEEEEKIWGSNSAEIWATLAGAWTRGAKQQAPPRETFRR
jgi:hypothetical protein